jgi:hypothetical protein
LAYKKICLFKNIVVTNQKIKKFPALPLRFSGCPSRFLAKFDMLV